MNSAWKIARFFLTEIIAGPNYLKDIDLRIIDEHNPADRPLVFAQNGTCKTTAISMIFSCLSPNKDRFIQYLQSGKDKGIESYVLSARSALILIEFVSHKPNGDLLGNEYQVGQRLLVGQLLLKKETAQNDSTLKRLFFMSESSTAFRDTRTLYADLASQSTAWSDWKRQLADLDCFHTENQSEWKSRLGSAGLDPWLLDKQVDFSTQESGIGKTLKFKDESHFLSFYLGTTLDPAHYMGVRESIELLLDKCQSIPKKKKELHIARQLETSLISFEEQASRWRSHESGKKELADHLSRAAQLVTRALPLAEREQNEHQSRLNQIASDIQAKDKSITTTEVDHLIILNAKRQRDAESIREELRQYTESLSADLLDEHHVEAANLTVLRDKAHTKVDRLREALQAVDNETAPLRQRIEQTRQQFHARCNHEFDLLHQEEKQLSDAIAEKRAQEKATQEKLRESNVQDKSITARLTKLSSSIDHANRSLLQLPLEPGETPEQASERLNAFILDTEDVIKELEGNANLEREKQQTHREAIRDAEHNRINLGHEQNKLDEWLQKESSLCQTAINNSCLLRLSEGEVADPYSDYILSELEDSISRKKTEIGNLEERCASLRSEMQRLNKLNTESEDDQIPALLAYYQQNGIKPAKLRSHVEYLDVTLERDVERIAHFMHQDPGRFTGLMATDKATLAAVLEIPTPPSLSRPVVVSLPEPAERTQESEYAYEVLKPANLDVYSPRAIEAKRLATEEKLQSLQATRRERQKEREEYQQAHDILLALRQHGQGNEYVASQKEALNGTRQALTNLDQSIAAHQSSESDCQRRISEMQAQAKQRNTQLIETKQSLNQVNHWLNTYQDLPAWQHEHESCLRKGSDLAALIKQTEEALEDIRQDIETRSRA